MDDQMGTTTTPQFTITRLFDAPRDVVWRAWTDPVQASVWWHPRGISTPADTVHLDPRIGGHYSYTMVNDATGEEYPTAGTYIEISEPERLVFTWGNPGDEDAPVVSITLRDVGELDAPTATPSLHLEEGPANILPLLAATGDE